MSRISTLALVAIAAAACSPAPAPKPLPGGLPPEYEAPRAFTTTPARPLPLEKGPGKPTDLVGPQPPAPTGTNPTTPAPAAGPVPVPPAAPPR